MHSDWKNMLTETTRDLAEEGKTPADVLWVEAGNGQMATWEEFASLADRTYYSGYGTETVDTSLMIVGDGWWMERRHEDGLEWWEFNSQPCRPEKPTALTAVFDEWAMSLNEKKRSAA